MVKRILSLLLLAVSCAVLWGLTQRSFSQPRLSELYVDQAVWDDVISSRTEHDFDGPFAQMFTSIRFNGYDLFDDVSRGMLLYSLIEGDESAYDPCVQVNGYYAQANIAAKGEKLSAELVRRGGRIPLLIYTEEEYAVFDLCFTTLPVMEIGAGSDQISYKDTITNVTLFDNRQEAAKRRFYSDAAVHIRGHGSLFHPKYSYRISLHTHSAGNTLRQNHTSLLGLREDEDWVINSLYTDRDKVREVVSTNLWYDSCANNNQWGIQNGMSYRYIELFMNGQYWGLYALGSPIDEKQVALQPGEHLYKKADPSYAEEEINFDAEGPVEGYEYRGGDLNKPDWEPLRAYYRLVMQGAEAEKEALYTAADPDNAVDLYLFLNLIQGVDHAHLDGKNMVYNLYMSAKKALDGSDTILYTPWDMDRTWGMDLESTYTLLPDDPVLMDSNPVHCLILQGDEAIRSRLTERYDELRSTVWSDASMLERAEGYAEDLFASGAFNREYARWFAEQTPPETLENFTAYMLERLSYMDGYIDALR